MTKLKLKIDTMCIQFIKKVYLQYDSRTPAGSKFKFSGHVEEDVKKLIGGEPITFPFPFLAAFPPRRYLDQNFGIAILFKIVEKSKYYTLGDNLSTTAS